MANDNADGTTSLLLAGIVHLQARAERRILIRVEQSTQLRRFASDRSRNLLFEPLQLDILELHDHPSVVDLQAEHPALQMVQKLFFEQSMGGRFEDRDFALDTYRQYCDDVIAEVPEDKRLVYEVSEGWAPLCQFLGHEVPAMPFPKKNTRLDFQTLNRLK